MRIPVLLFDYQFNLSELVGKIHSGVIWLHNIRVRFFKATLCALARLVNKAHELMIFCMN